MTHAQAGPPNENGLYVGYLPTPRRDRRALRLLVPTILWGLCAISALIAANLAPAGDAVWDSETTTIDGVLISRPYPAVVSLESGSQTMTFLVESGKHGARPELQGDSERAITVEGFLLHRDGRRVLELLPGADGVKAPRGARADDFTSQRLGDATLRGEIVDYKCYLGAMKPGHGLTHRACATLCVSGGIPPTLVTTDAAGHRAYYVLRSPDRGALNAQVLAVVGVPVEIMGTVVREAGMLYLETSAGMIKPL